MEYLAFRGIAVVFSIVGFYFAMMAFSSFKNTPVDVLRAKVFLSKNFLRNNLIIIFSVGALASVHAILELVEALSIPFPYHDLLYSITLPISTFLMALLAYFWNKALYMKSEMFVKTE